MHLSLKSLVTGAGLVLVMGAVAHAQKNTTVPCKDGTTSTVSGRGACSGHGGVNGEAKAAQEKASNTAKKTAKKAEKAEEKSETKAQEKAEKAEAKMVKCTDGTESKGGRGACSGHGGIMKKAKKAAKPKSTK
jgi:hypothetical protein